MKIYEISVIKNSNYFHIEGVTNEYMNIKYGVDSINAKNCYIEDAKGDVIYISKNIADTLKIIDSVKYQIYIEDSDLIIGPVIGFIVTPQTLKYSKRYFKKYIDRLMKYDNYKGLFVFYSLCNTNLDTNTVYGLYYDNDSDDFIYKKLPLPKYNYRRNFKDSKKLISKLEDHSAIIYNNNKIIKQEFYDYMSTTKLREHIPFTYRVKYIKCILELVNKHTNIILKPKDLSRGRGIAIIKKAGNKYQIYRYPDVRFYTYTELDLLEMLSEYELSNYLVQEYLELNNYKGYIYDIRVVVQLANNNYKITGIETRVSRNNTITNVSGGATVISYRDALKDLSKEDTLIVARKIKDVCIRTAEILNKNNNIIELGIDVALTTDLSIYLLEANIYPSFKGFISLNDNVYQKIRFNPIKELIRMEGLEVNDQEV